MTRIGLDGRCLNTSHLRGMGKAMFELLRYSGGRDDLRFVIFGDEPKAPVHRPEHAGISSHIWEVTGHRFRAWEQIGLPRAAARLECDLLHCTGTWCPYWQPVPTVVTVHDTLPWIEEGDGVYLNRILPAAYRRAKAIITISERSKRDVLERWPDLAGKLTVVRHGIRPAYFAEQCAPLDQRLVEAGVRRPYLLYVGGEVARKRLEWAVDVWTALDDGRINLVVCGLEARSIAAWRERVREDLRARFICLDFVPEDSLPSLYARAEAVLYPTTYEGFGFPALEAQAVGVPVLMSEVGSLGELAGPGAILLPLNDLSAWVDTCRRILSGDRIIDADSARAWATGFGWEQAAARTADVYDAVLSGRPVA
jgi:glycosyltransferase involved in cell wall biosynthesis